MTRQAIYYWKKKPIPYNRQCMIEVVTEGALKADGGPVPPDWNRYERLKREWEERHPVASPKRSHTAILSIARRCGIPSGS